MQIDREKMKSWDKVNTTWPKFTLNYEIVVRTAHRNENVELLQWNWWVCVATEPEQTLPLHRCLPNEHINDPRMPRGRTMRKRIWYFHKWSWASEVEMENKKNFLNKHILFKYPMSLDDNGCCDCSPSFLPWSPECTHTHSRTPLSVCHSICQPETTY